MPEMERNYCVFLDPRKYNRNDLCHQHDNQYGIHGGGGERDRWRVDRAFYRRMKRHGDPMALPALIACLTCGWFFWNYHPGRWLWTGQMLRKFAKSKW